MQISKSIFYIEKCNLVIMNILKIKELSEKRAGGLKKLAKDIDMSETNLHRCINANKIQANDLEKIASIFKIPISYFFEDTPNGNITQTGNGNVGNVIGNSNRVMVSDCESRLEIAEKEKEHLRALLEEKERLIQVLMKK
jgi:DNA-binding Xre family transcriptional regulator